MTSEQLMTYLTDNRRTDRPMGRDNAHELAALLATKAFESKTPFVDVVLAEPEITARFTEETIRAITDPFAYVGQSREQIERAFELYHGK